MNLLLFLPEKDFFISFLIFSLFFDKRKIIKQISYEKHFFKTVFLISSPMFWLKSYLILIVFQGISHSQKPFFLPFFFQPALFLSGNEATIQIKQWLFAWRCSLFSIVPYIVGKCSLLVGERFSYFVGINSHNIREHFPIIYGTIGTTVYLQPEKRRRQYLTMRNTLKYYENKVNFKLKQKAYYEKCRLRKSFS